MVHEACGTLQILRALVCSTRRAWTSTARRCPWVSAKPGACLLFNEQLRHSPEKINSFRGFRLPDGVLNAPSAGRRLPVNYPIALWLSSTALCTKRPTGRRHYRLRARGRSGTRSIKGDLGCKASDSTMQMWCSTFQQPTFDIIPGERSGESVCWCSMCGSGCLDNMAVGALPTGEAGIYLLAASEIGG